MSKIQSSSQQKRRFYRKVDADREVGGARTLCVYPQVINCGESIHFVGPPLAIDMSTAIAIVFTDYGFGIAADSRHCEEGNDTPLSDSVEKIFELDCVAGCSAAYMLCGIMEIVLKLSLIHI